MIAARSGRTDITNFLLEGKHINVDIQENGTGWSALHFSAERGDWDTTQVLLKAGASPHLKDKNGLTAMEIAEVKAEEGEEGRPYDEYREERPQYNYEGVISLLREHCKEEPTAATSHHESSDCGHDSAPPTQQDSSTVDEDTPPTQQDIIDTTQITSHQRIGRRNISQALRNLVNRTGQIAVQIFNDLDRRLKSADKNDQSESQNPSSYKVDRKHPGIRFFRGPWKQSVTSAGAHITWREEIGVEFDIPPGAVPEGRELDLSVWPCYNGPFRLQDGYELASPVFLISPSFKFSREITLTLWHFSNLETVEDSERMVFLSAPSTPNTKRAGKKPAYQFRVLGKGVFEPRQDYGRISLTHFCYVGAGRKRKKHSSPSDSPLSKKPRDENRYVYQVYQDRQFGDTAIFSAFLDQKLYFILTKEMVDSHQRHPYPQMILLEVEKSATSSTISPSIPVEIVGIREPGERFILKPKLRQTGLTLQSSLSSPSHALQPSQTLSYRRDQADTAGASVEQARQGPSHPNLRDLFNNIRTTKWYEFGLQLTSNIEELNTIKTDHKGDARTALLDTLNLVLREDPDLSWQKVVQALQTIGEVVMAQTINEKFC
ncbi:hypothetical protein GBAR_LOCUS3697 [Geodia barretti]|uniref:ZU5 domain-containing protein n=1 Tax=Geodia barretti TaxID=519541 RepID=A0AA35W782_GEOBA|nr:hypothetical protein GBAR_LOCUS3697 [Geodia barretti]